jgi:hypothetical protein
MAKRFTDTDKYKKPFIRNLPGQYKLFWDYLYHDCNHAGVWIVDFQIAQIYLGTDMIVEKDVAIKLFNDGKIRIVEFDKKSKWFIPSFVKFQYGKLKESNNAHKSVISILTENNLIKHLMSPSPGAKDKDMDMDKELVKVKVKEKDMTDYEKAIHEFKKMRKKIRKPATDYAIELIEKKLEKLAPGDDKLKIEILNKSTVKSWQDVFPLKEPINDFSIKPNPFGEVEKELPY